MDTKQWHFKECNEFYKHIKDLSEQINWMMKFIEHYSSKTTQESVNKKDHLGYRAKTENIKYHIDQLEMFIKFFKEEEKIYE